MAKRLTEEMVIARTKISDLSKIKRLNCWGSELVDVTLLRKMPCVEVLSLSINKINSLMDFQFCKCLEELYIRQNDIQDINEVMYLQKLANLKNLWLGENPCASTEGYRLAIIKALPHLQKLDNVIVTQDELREALKHGKTLSHPDYTEESEDEYEAHLKYNNQAQESLSDTEYSPLQRSPVQKSPSRQETAEYELEEIEDAYPREDASEGSREFSPPMQTTLPKKSEVARQPHSSSEAYVEKKRENHEQISSRQYPEQRLPSTNHSFDDQSNDGLFKENKIITSQSASCIKDFVNDDKYASIQKNYRQNENVNEGHEKRERHSCLAAAHRPPFQRRPVTRNSNILSAILCLVKELDYPSLEVVEMAVRCRMDELDE